MRRFAQDEFGIWAERDVSSRLRTGVRGKRRRYCSGGGGDIDIGEQHLLIPFIGLGVEGFADLVGRVAEVEQLAYEQSLEVMAKSVDGIASVFFGRIQAPESLVMP